MFQSINTTLNRIRRVRKRLVEYGARKTIKIITNRLQVAWADRILRSRARKGQLQNNWSAIAAKHGLPIQFALFWQQRSKRQLDYLANLVPDVGTPVAVQAIALADAAAEKTFDLLGSGPCSFTNIPWHLDMRLYKQLLGQGVNESVARQQSSFDAQLFYKDIPIEVGSTSALAKDIKLPWELSRFYHAVAFGHAYVLTGNRKYTHAFVEQVTDWLDTNPYLLGPNWACPMEVGIRALNLIYAMQYMRVDQTIPLTFWERLTASLYDHMEYLENNWEVYDGITNNHYMSDLVGHLALCWFFNFEKEGDTTVSAFEAEVKKQVFPEGTDYESTTSYHRLVTELVYHGWKLCAALGYEEEAGRIQPLVYGMLTATRWFGDIKIGDDDSGRLLYHGLTDEMLNGLPIDTNITGVRHYPSFGLSVAMQNPWRVSLRHLARAKNQPASHMHNDIGSITVAIRERPLIIDPGSFVYTPSEFWRNHFRSITNHNTFYIKDREPVPLDERIFSLDMPENVVTWLVPTNLGAPAPLTTRHGLYALLGLSAHRALVIEDDSIEIHDWWQGTPCTQGELKLGSVTSLITAWNFTLAPDIAVNIKDEWIELVDATTKEPLARIGSEQLLFTAIDGWMSPSYGVKKRCIQLRAERRLALEEDVLIQIHIP